MKQITSITMVLLAALACSCETIIEPDLNFTTPELVIQGAVTDSTGPYQISITRTADFYNENFYETVSGANILISDVTLSITDTLTETAPGIYSTRSLRGIPGNTYRLTVRVEGREYMSTSTMPMPVTLDSVSISYEKSDNFEPVVHFQDNAASVNYYKYSVYLNGIPAKRFQTFQDLLSNGKFIIENVDVDENSLKSGDIVTVTLASVERSVYNFLKGAEDVAYDNDELVSPALPTSNITGGCIGYFSAQTVSSKDAIVR